MDVRHSLLLPSALSPSVETPARGRSDHPDKPHDDQRQRNPPKDLDCEPEPEQNQREQQNQQQCTHDWPPFFASVNPPRYGSVTANKRSCDIGNSTVTASNEYRLMKTQSSDRVQELRDAVGLESRESTSHNAK